MESGGSIEVAVAEAQDYVSNWLKSYEAKICGKPEFPATVGVFYFDRNGVVHAEAIGEKLNEPSRDECDVDVKMLQCMGSGSRIAFKYFLGIRDRPFNELQDVIQILQECVTAASICDPSSGGHFHMGTIKFKYTSFIRDERPLILSKMVESYANFNRYFECRLVIGTKAKLAEEDYVSEIKKKFSEVARIGVLLSSFSARILKFPAKETMIEAVDIMNNRNILKALYDKEIGDHAIKGYIEQIDKTKRQKVAARDKFWVQRITRELLLAILSEVGN